jgi:hypothetical protein
VVLIAAIDFVSAFDGEVRVKCPPMAVALDERHDDRVGLVRVCHFRRTVVGGLMLLRWLGGVYDARPGHDALRKATIVTSFQSPVCGGPTGAAPLR